jgi:hypothetical protein
MMTAARRAHIIAVMLAIASGSCRRVGVNAGEAMHPCKNTACPSNAAEGNFTARPMADFATRKVTFSCGCPEGLMGRIHCFEDGSRSGTCVPNMCLGQPKGTGCTTPDGTDGVCSDILYSEWTPEYMPGVSGCWEWGGYIQNHSGCEYLRACARKREIMTNITTWIPTLPEMVTTSDDVTFNVHKASIILDAEITDWECMEYKQQQPFAIKDHFGIGEHKVVFGEYKSNFDYSEQRVPRDPLDHTLAFSMAWQPDAFYLLVQVADESHENRGSGWLVSLSQKHTATTVVASHHIEIHKNTE